MIRQTKNPKHNLEEFARLCELQNAHVTEARWTTKRLMITIALIDIRYFWTNFCCCGYHSLLFFWL